MYTHKLNHIQVAVDIFVANNHGNQKYSESYRNDFDTWLKVLGIVSNEIYRYRPCLHNTRKFLFFLGGFHTVIMLVKLFSSSSIIDLFNSFYVAKTTREEIITSPQGS